MEHQIETGNPGSCLFPMINMIGLRHAALLMILPA